jgi:hypothetical protein
MKRYLVQQTTLAETLRRGCEPVWIYVATCFFKWQVRHKYWKLVWSTTDIRHIYRMYDNRENEVIS